MKLSRKRKRELKQLRSFAENVLEDQKIVLGRAGDVLYEASRQARHLGDEHVAPRVTDAVESVRPSVDRSVAMARTAVDNVRRVATPVVTAALANTVRTLEAIDDPRAKTASHKLVSLSERSGLVPTKKRSNVGGFIALGLGVAAAVGVGYALWQTFRADDELWVASDEM